MSENGLTDNIEDVKRHLNQFQEQYEHLEEKLSQIEDVKQDLEKRVDVEASNIDFDRLAEFVTDEYWLINEVGDNEYEIWIPKFMDVQAGVLDRQKGGYNVFILDQTTKMISGVPEFLQDDVDLTDEQRFKVKGDLLEFDEEQRDVVEEQLSEHVEDVKEEKATIKQDHGHALVRNLLDRGEMPFTPMQVDDADVRESETEHDLYDYQERAYNEFLEHGAVTVAYMTGAGKTHIGIEALDTLRYDPETGRKAVVVWSKITAEQWKNRMEEYAPRLNPVIMSGRDVTDIPDTEDTVEIYTYQSLHKLEAMINRGNEYIMIQFDEADFLPAKTFSRASTYPAKYRMGHTASPVRSAENPNDVFALCGKPIGLNWQENLDLMDQTMFPVNIHVVSDMDAKIDRLEEIRDTEKKTLVFVERIEYGEKVSDRTGLEFVHGSHNNQKEKIEDAIMEDNAVIVSRIANRGMSIGNVERLIELDSRGDSRREIIQRLGRLFHGSGEQADVIYTIGEANSYEERFYALVEKGFDINDVDDALRMEDIGESAEGVVDIDVDGGEFVEPGESVGDERYGTAPVPEDPIEFLKDDGIQDIIEEKMDGYSRVSDKDMWDTIIAVAQSDDGLSHKEIERLFPDANTSGNRYTKPFRESDPQILVENEDGKYELNVSEWKEIKEQQRKVKKKRKELAELREDVLGG